MSNTTRILNGPSIRLASVRNGDIYSALNPLDTEQMCGAEEAQHSKHSMLWQSGHGVDVFARTQITTGFARADVHASPAKNVCARTIHTPAITYYRSDAFSAKTLPRLSSMATAMVCAGEGSDYELAITATADRLN